MIIKTFDSESAFGYKQISTFYSDFSIADAFGIKAVKDTYKRCFNYFKDHYKMLTELVMVLNWKCWEHYEDGNEDLTCLYRNLYEVCNEYAMNHLKDEELAYFFRTTD